jgi:hypothetical protein
MNHCPWAPKYSIRAVWNFLKTCGGIRAWMFITRVNKTGDKLFSGVNDTGNKFIASVVLILGTDFQWWPVLLILVNSYRRWQWHRWTICRRFTVLQKKRTDLCRRYSLLPVEKFIGSVVDTGEQSIVGVIDTGEQFIVGVVCTSQKYPKSLKIIAIVNHTAE